MSTAAAPQRLAYRPRDAAELLSVSTRTISRWIESGRLRAVRDGGVTLIPAAELDRILRPAAPASADPKADKIAREMLAGWRGV